MDHSSKVSAAVDKNCRAGGNTGILSQMRTKLRDWAVRQAKAGCYSQASLSSNDSKTL